MPRDIDHVGYELIKSQDLSADDELLLSDSSAGLAGFTKRISMAEMSDYLNGVLVPSIKGWFDVSSTLYGAKGDGGTVDTAAIQAAIDDAKAAGGGVVWFPAGTYILDDALSLLLMRDIALWGAGRFSTKLLQTKVDTPCVQTNGLWYSRVEGLRFETSVAQSQSLFELDGNYDGINTLGVQGNTFKDCLFVGNSLANYCLQVVRQSGGAGQGSENLFLNCHFNGALQYCYRQLGLNALANRFEGGDMQAYGRGGIAGVGSVQVAGTSFESTNGYQQILNDGYDIDMSGGGVFDVVTAIGCRSESLRFYRGSGAQTGNIKGFSHVTSIYPRGVQTYALNDCVTGITAAGNFKMYRCTTPGTTSGAEPVWPETGTVADGTVVWTFTDFDVISLAQGTVDGAVIQLGSVFGNDGADFSNISFRRKDPWLSTAANSRYLVSGGNATFSNCYYVLVSGGAIAPLSGVAGVALPAKLCQNIADGAIVAVSGSGGATYEPISLYRGNGNVAIPILNWWDHQGGWRHTGLTFAQITTFGTTGNGMLPGVTVFCTDGTPGDPLSGGGSGCMAYFANGRWKGI